MALFDEQQLFELSEKVGALSDEENLSDREKLIRTLQKDIEESEATETENFDSVLKDIESAKQRLLVQPSRSDTLRQIATKLTQQRSPDDPRFYERQNLYTFLRDIGEVGSEQAAARKAAEQEAAKLDQLANKYRLERTQDRGSKARQLLAQYLSKEPETQTGRGLTRETQTGRQQGSSSSEQLPASLREVQYYQNIVNNPDKFSPEEVDYARKWLAKSVRVPEESAAPPEKFDQDANDFKIIGDPGAFSDAEVRAANARIRKKFPSISEDEKGQLRDLTRVRHQFQFTVPLIKEAIAQAKAGGALATGNLSRWVEGLPWIGQAATDLERTLDAIKSNIGFNKLEDLKGLSQFGASGLGAVSNAEQILLQSTLGSISRDQKEENLVYQLTRILNFYEKDMLDILERTSGIKGITNIDKAIKEIENKNRANYFPSSTTRPTPPAAPPVEKTPAEKARDELNRRRSGGSQ